MYNASIISLIYWYAPAFCPLPLFRSRRCFGLYGHWRRTGDSENKILETAYRGSIEAVLLDEGEYR